MNQKLKSCPFCQGININFYTLGDESCGYCFPFECSDCDFNMYFKGVETKLQAIEAWNKRGGEKLKPCPKCNGDKVDYVTSSDKGNYFRCSDCKWHPQGRKNIKENEVIFRWNDRT